jgi:hypothetical protein
MDKWVFVKWVRYLFVSCAIVQLLFQVTNFWQHSETKHKDLKERDESGRQLKAVLLSKALSVEENIFSKAVTESESITKVSLKISR